MRFVRFFAGPLLLVSGFQIAGAGVFDGWREFAGYTVAVAGAVLWDWDRR